MAGTTVIDRLVAVLGYKFDPGGIDAFEKRLDGAKAKVTAFGERLDSAGRKLQSYGTKASAAVAGVVFAGIRTDAAMKTLEARTGATTEQLKAFKDQALEVGSKLPLTTAEIIAAQTAYVQLGNSIEEALASTPAIAYAAVASDTLEIESAARYASIASSQFGLDSSELGRVLDSLLVTEQNTAAVAGDLGAALRFSGQAAADAGLDIETYVATLGVLAGSGRSAEESSQGLNVMMSKLAKSSVEWSRGGTMVRKAFAGIGVDADEARALLDEGGAGFVKFVQLLNEKSRELPRATITAFLTALVGESYASSFSYLIQNADQLENVAALNFDAQGESARQAQIKMTGLSGAWESFKAQVDTVLNLLSDAGIGAVITGLFKHLNALLTWFVKAPGWVKSTTAAVMLLGAALLPLGISLRVVGAALKGFGVLLGTASWLMKMFTTHAVGTRIALLAQAAATKIAAAAQWLWNAAVAAFPIIAIVVAIAAAIYAIYRFRAEIGDFLLWTGGRIAAAFRAIGGFLADNWKLILVALAGPFGWIAAAVWRYRDEIWDAITGVVSAIRDFFVGMHQRFYDAGRGLFGAIIDGIKSRAQEIWDAVKAIVSKVRDLLPFSDAKEGPLSRLTQSGRSLGDTFAAGIASSGDAVRSATSRMLPNMVAGMGRPLPVGPPPAAFASANPSTRQVTVVVHMGDISIHAPGGDPEEIAARVGEATRRQVNRALVEEFDSDVRA